MANNEIASQQKSFNPSWMQASPLKMPMTKSNGMHRTSNEEEDVEMMDPIFAKHRYGREDILALIPKDSKGPPDGLRSCPYFVERPQMPIILSPLTEAEQRLQTNINSSKALSAAHRNDWQNKEGNDGSNSPQTNNPWTIAGSSRSGSSFRSSNNRWTAPNTNEGSRSTKPYAGFGRQNYGNGGGSDKLRQSKNTWTDSNGGSGFNKQRQHLKSGSEETTRNDGDQSKAPSSDAWGNSWRSTDSNRFNDKNKGTATETTLNRQTESSKNEQTPKDKVWSSTPNDSVWPASSLNETPVEKEKAGNLAHSAVASSPDQPTDIGVNRPKAPPNQSTDAVDPSDEWYYLDPTDTERGSFTSDQMQAWFTNGYFQSDLRIRFAESSYTTLGDLIKLNGALTPFVNSKSQETTRQSPVTRPPIIPSSAQASAPWPSGSEAQKPPQGIQKNFVSQDNELSLETLKILEVKERMIAEEQRKIQEKEEAIKNEEKARQEKAAALRELEQQLERQRIEIETRAREQERQLELHRQQILEYERQQREKLEKFEQERKLQVQQEELNRRRQVELQLAQQERDRQQLLLRAEIQQNEQKRLFQEKRLQEAVEFQRQQERARLQQEEAERLKAAELIRLERVAQYEHQKLMVEEQQRLAALQQQQRLMVAKAAPWAHDRQQRAPEFREIQEQERMQMLRQQQMNEEKRRELEAAQKAKPQGNGNPWNIVRTKPVPIPLPKESQQPKAAPKKTNKKESPVREAQMEDPLTAWVCLRIRQMNPNIDADVFAPFLLGFESPNEVEDYIITYFGETKAAKQFHQEFLTKRIELRPKRDAKKEDDLSAPAQAIDTGVAPSSSGTKKKTKKAKQVDVSDLMSFRAVGGNRFNAGEIDTDIPMSTKKGKKK